MSRQFGLKPSSVRKRPAEPVRSLELSEMAKVDAPLAPEQGPMESEPLYAPASWRGNNVRRCVSAS
jgi:hypothetical protein